MADQKRHWLHTVHAGHLGLKDGIELQEFIDGMNHWCSNLMLDTRLRYMCGQVEKCPETGTLHGQMYTEWTKSLRLSELIKVAPSHAEYRKGTRTDARNYCTSTIYNGEDKGKLADLPAFGEWREDTEGKTRKDTQKELAIHYVVNEGLTPNEIARKDPLVYFTYHYAIERLYNARSSGC